SNNIVCYTSERRCNRSFVHRGASLSKSCHLAIATTGLSSFISLGGGAPQPPEKKFLMRVGRNNRINAQSLSIFAAVHKSASGTSRHFATTQHFGRFLDRSGHHRVVSTSGAYFQNLTANGGGICLFKNQQVFPPRFSTNC